MANKLELTWFNKEIESKIEPRILIENTELSNIKNDSNTENILIHGDNLLALKALENKYSGKVKCIYIDPPYNTGSAFEHYDDNLEHSTWLSLMRDRLVILRNLLSDDGSIWISIDDEECDYLKILCDEIFGRNNYITKISWWRNYASANDSKTFAKVIDYVLIYQKTSTFKRNLLPRTEKQNALYKYDSNDGMGKWRSDNLSVRTYSANYDYPIKNPNTGIEYNPPQGRSWMTNKETVEKWIKEGRIFFGQKGNGAPQLKRYLNEVQKGVIPTNFWSYEDVGHTDEARKEIKALFDKDLFATPKPERLIQRILTLATNENDLVLDSFLGSGTTAAVAHKMNRRWIGIEMGNHAYTHCKVRLDKVINGEDKGGITKSVNWNGGGSYRFYELAPSLIVKDEFDEEIINPKYNAQMLASAVALHEGFTYQPDSALFWKQSFGSEKSFLFVTTKHISQSFVDSIYSTMKEDEYLIIACRSFDSGCEKSYKNITIKKIPQMLLENCEFSKDNYDLNIINPPVYEDEEEEESENDK